jgi:hypothetical protein
VDERLEVASQMSESMSHQGNSEQQGMKNDKRKGVIYAKKKCIYKK